MEKKTYAAPETEIVELEAADVIRTSINNVSYPGGSSGWGNRNNGGTGTNTTNNYGWSDGPGSGNGENGTMLING